MQRIIFLLAFLVLTPLVFAQQEVHIRAPQGPGDAAHSYYRDLLQKVLDNTAPDFGPAVVVETDINTSQARALLMVKNAQLLDVDWAGTNIDREAFLHPIRVPLNLGLLGERLLTIDKNRHAEFDQINDISELREKTACQGQHWPDSDILETNHFKVERVIAFELMWDMLQFKRCDYFPRAVIEGYVEVQSYGSDRFEAYDRILISYPFPMFFFVAIENTALATRLEAGLTQMLEDGILLRFMQKHPATRNAFPLSRYQKSLRFKIENPFLTKETQAVMKGLAVMP